eukprot:TRINITY_DN32794_c0_g1_i1.p1 TRINITY_DN32794_c0_g1~~TRINITY_DN32794_c0_g1_i1.p1  ORF type:complete len:603 (-),score=137.65 TRINITY_DN32794_c0_g1_i1:3-1718(-)
MAGRSSPLLAPLLMRDVTSRRILGLASRVAGGARLARAPASAASLPLPRRLAARIGDYSGRSCWPRAYVCARDFAVLADASSTGSSSSSTSEPGALASTLSGSLATGNVELPRGISPEDAELLASLNAAVASLGEEADSDHPIVAARDKVALAFRDKAALLKRDWTDEMFQDGEDENEDRVAEIEAMLATGLGRSGAGLEDGGNLGSALDLVGVYMKNYKLDKADAVLARCGEYVSERGGVWMVKWLNHVSTVRMKQGRNLEALEMLYDLELYSPYNASEAPEFFETLYRNLAWALKSLGRIDEAVEYFERMAKASKQHKGKLDWFDCWDIGKLAATRAFRDGDMPAFYRGRALVKDSLEMHREQEPEDLVMRAKVLDSLAECYLVTQEYEEARKYYDEAYKLFLETVGPNSPLFGKQARHSANLLIAQDEHAQALPYLGQALAVEAAKDAAKVPELLELVDLIVNTHQRCGGKGAEDIPSNHPALKALQKNLVARGLDQDYSYGILCHKMSLMYLHESQRDDRAVRRALRLAKASVRTLRAFQQGQDSSDWLRMSELHLKMLASVRKRPT